MAGTRPLRDIKAAEVRDAVAALMPELGYAENDHVFIGQVMRKLGARESGDDSSGYRDWRYEQDREKFNGQVVRALNALAADGTLRKVPRGEPLPSGSWGRGSCWLTPEAWEKAEKEGLERKQAEEEAAARWQRISERAGALGILLPSPQEPGARALEQLLDLAEQGRKGVPGHG